MENIRLKLTIFTSVSLQLQKIPHIVTPTRNVIFATIMIANDTQQMKEKGSLIVE